MTGCPSINPLSRKVAELVTRREMESLGMLPRESSPKVLRPPHTRHAFSNEPEPRKHNTHKSSLKEIPKLDENSSISKKNASNTGSELSAAMNSLPTAPETATRLHPDLHIIISDQELSETQKSEIERKNSCEELIEHAENIKAFQDELHREYPELGLNNSIEGSSFHTNELNELEEACNGMSSDKAPAAETLHVQENNNNNKDKDIEKLSICSVYGESVAEEKKFSRLVENVETQKIFQTHGSVELAGTSHEKFMENTEASRSIAGMISKSKLEGSITKSKFNSQSLIEFPSKDFSNMQNSFMRASFLHSQQEVVPRSVPRCHINLLNCVSSPLFYSVKVNPDSKVKCENGLGQADSLRKFLLDQKDPEAPRARKDFYSKNLDWLQKKDSRVDRLRENKKQKEALNYTFDPFYQKHQSNKHCRSSFDFQPSILSQQLTPRAQEFVPKIPENTLQYNSLTPATSRIGFHAGCSINQLLEKAKPMVSYRSVNLLK